MNLAISLDGFIADLDGGFGWIQGDGDSTHNTKKSFNYHEFLDTVGTIVMGSKSFDDCPDETLEEFRNRKVIVATSRSISCGENVELFAGDIVDKILGIVKQSDKDIWLFGGAKLVEPFIKETAVDEWIIGIIPVILGSGIRLFGEGNPTIELHMEDLYIDNGITIIKYTNRSTTKK